MTEKTQSGVQETLRGSHERYEKTFEKVWSELDFQKDRVSKLWTQIEEKLAAEGEDRLSGIKNMQAALKAYKAEVSKALEENADRTRITQERIVGMRA